MVVSAFSGAPIRTTVLAHRLEIITERARMIVARDADRVEMISGETADSRGI